MNSKDGFILLDFIKGVFSGWKRVVVFMIMGGLCGMLASTTITPVYETRAVIAVTIDYTRTGALSDIQEDQAMRGLGSVIDSDTVRDQVVLEAQELGYVIDRNEIENSFTLEREDFRWFLRVRGDDPIRAADLATVWANVAMRVLDDGMEHAIIAGHLQQYLDSLEYCLQRQAVEGVVGNICADYDFDFLMDEVQVTSAEIRDQQAVSFGLMPAMEFFLAEKAPVNAEPVLGTRGILILCGAVLGFLLAAMFPLKENE